MKKMKKKKVAVASGRQKAKATSRAPKGKQVEKTKAVAKGKVEAKAESTVPKKLKLSKEDGGRYMKLLLDLRDHLIDGVSFLASDNLKRSHRDATGELSGYSMHMADAGTDNFDREFALGLVSNEQEALYEIEESLKRLEAGTFGVCEMCEKPIRKERQIGRAHV